MMKIGLEKITIKNPKLVKDKIITIKLMLILLHYNIVLGHREVL